LHPVIKTTDVIDTIARVVNSLFDFFFLGFKLFILYKIKPVDSGMCYTISEICYIIHTFIVAVRFDSAPIPDEDIRGNYR